MRCSAVFLILLLAVSARAGPLAPVSSREVIKLTREEYAHWKQMLKHTIENFMEWLRHFRESNDQPDVQPSAPPVDSSMSPTPAKPTTSPTFTRSPSPSSTPASATGMIAEILAVHNKERSLSGIAPLSWSTELAGSAQQWADVIVKEPGLRHSNGVFLGVGENLWKGWGSSFSYTRMVSAWANEKKNFAYGTFPNVKISNGAVGHYTQMIWRDTKQIGCATAGQPSSGIVLVCHYRKHGNIVGEKPF